MRTIWCELAWTGGDEATAGVTVTVDRERIVAIGRDASAPAGAEIRRGVTLPGIANAHSHAFHRALRGRTQGGTGSFWTWREQMYAVAAGLDPDSLHRLARAAFGEMVLAGFTTVGEFHYVHHQADGTPYEEPTAMAAAIVQAAAEAGVRLTLLDTCYLHGGIGDPPAGPQRRFADRDVDAWVERASTLAEGRMVRVGAAVHSVRACSPAEIEVVADWARHRSAPLHAHVSEQAAENEASVAAYGATPTEVLHAAGAVDDRFTAVHATHVTGRDRALLGVGSACLCPTTERDLADGIGPAAQLAASGATLALGSDSQAVVDPFEEARAVELDERLATGERGRLGTVALLEALTTGGHRSLGWADAGRLENGCRADLVTVSLDGVRLAGTRPAEALAAVVFAAAAGDVTHVTVDGRDVVVDRDHVHLDVAAELRAVLA